MRIVPRQTFIAFLAVIFAASGISPQTCLAAQPSAAKAIAAPHSHVDLHQVHSMNEKLHHDHRLHVTSPASDTDSQPVNDHSSTKCCSLCLLSGIAPAILNAAAIFTISSISFELASRDILGHAVPIDPGIPKRIV